MPSVHVGDGAGGRRRSAPSRRRSRSRCKTTHGLPSGQATGAECAAVDGALAAVLDTVAARRGARRRRPWQTALCAVGRAAAGAPRARRAKGRRPRSRRRPRRRSSAPSVQVGAQVSAAGCRRRRGSRRRPLQPCRRRACRHAGAAAVDVGLAAVQDAVAAAGAAQRPARAARARAVARPWRRRSPGQAAAHVGAAAVDVGLERPRGGRQRTSAASGTPREARRRSRSRRPPRTRGRGRTAGKPRRRSPCPSRARSPRRRCTSPHNCHFADAPRAVGGGLADAPGAAGRARPTPAVHVGLGTVLLAVRARRRTTATLADTPLAVGAALARLAGLAADRAHDPTIDGGLSAVRDAVAARRRGAHHRFANEARAVGPRRAWLAVGANCAGTAAIQPGFPAVLDAVVADWRAANMLFANAICAVGADVARDAHPTSVADVATALRARRARRLVVEATLPVVTAVSPALADDPAAVRVDDTWGLAAGAAAGPPGAARRLVAAPPVPVLSARQPAARPATARAPERNANAANEADFTPGDRAILEGITRMSFTAPVPRKNDATASPAVPSERAAPGDRSRSADVSLERALLVNFVIHGVAMLAMALVLAPMLPGGGEPDPVVRVSNIAAHPWLFRAGWLPWQLCAVADLWLAIALVRVRWIPRAASLVVLVLTIAAVIPDQYAQAVWITRGVDLAQGARSTADLARYFDFEAPTFVLTAGWGAVFYTLAAIGWTVCLWRARLLSRALLVVSVVAWTVMIFVTTVLLVPPAWRIAPEAVALGNALGFVLLEVWLALAAEAVLRRRRPLGIAGRDAPWRHPWAGALGRALDTVANSRFAAAFLEPLPALAMVSDITDVVYVNYLLPADSLVTTGPLRPGAPASRPRRPICPVHVPDLQTRPLRLPDARPAAPLDAESGADQLAHSRARPADRHEGHLLRDQRHREHDVLVRRAHAHRGNADARPRDRRSPPRRGRHDVSPPRPRCGQRPRRRGDVEALRGAGFRGPLEGLFPHVPRFWPTRSRRTER